jgi:hypothetical protein
MVIAHSRDLWLPYDVEQAAGANTALAASSPALTAIVKGFSFKAVSPMVNFYVMAS